MVQIEDMQMIIDRVQLLHRLIEKQTALIIQFIKVLYKIDVDFKIIINEDNVEFLGELNFILASCLSYLEQQAKEETESGPYLDNQTKSHGPD